MEIAGDETEYLFANPLKPNKPISREHFTRQINKFLKEMEEEFHTRFTSHSFRKGYINTLWKNSLDMGFVRQAIGHVKSQTPQQYLKPYGEQRVGEQIQSIP
jgi:integrase